MAEPASARRDWDAPPVVSQLACAQLPGFSARLVRNEPATFDTGAWPDVRVRVPRTPYEGAVAAPVELDRGRRGW